MADFFAQAEELNLVSAAHNAEIDGVKLKHMSTSQLASAAATRGIAMGPRASLIRALASHARANDPGDDKNAAHPRYTMYTGRAQKTPVNSFRN